jgi:hypothetical protein
MATPNQPQLSDSQLAELEKIARAQERSVDEVLSKRWTAISGICSGKRSSAMV